MADPILVTGGAGFVGAALIQRLAETNPARPIVSLDNYFTGSTENHVDSPSVTYLEGNTWDVEKIWADKGFANPGRVFHLGEYSRIVQSFGDFDRVWEYNLRGTKEVIHFSQRRNARLIYAGSSSKFADDGDGENFNPYAWTKSKNVEYIRNIGSWFGLDYVITYFYNVYGPGQIRDGRYATVLGIFERQMLAGQPLTVVSPGTQTRDFTHIEDIVDGILLCAERGSGDGYMLGSGKEWKIVDVATMFRAPIEMMPALPGERRNGRADVTKARELGWVAKHDLAEYVATFVANNPR